MSLYLSKFLILFLFLIVTLLRAEDFSNLLDNYTKASELSLKTKDENAGNLIVYTRDDIERMQANTLKDLLKSLRYFSYSENRQVQSDLLNLDTFSNNSKGIRLYLNEHELLSPLYGSGFIYFGDMELEFIDHIEIYTGFPSFEFGIEPAMVVIRLYTKNAEHDEGGKVKLLGGSNSSYLGSAYYADKFDDLSYFTYLGQYNNQRDDYSSDANGNLKRDQLRNRFYGSLSTENHSLELHALQTKNDAFLGSTKDYATRVKTNNLEYQYLSLSEHSEFMQKSLSFSASYTTITKEFQEEFDRITPPIPLSSEYNTKEESLTLSTQKNFSISDNELSMGPEYRYKYFDISDQTFDDTPINFQQAYVTEHIYSMFIQDLYALSQYSNINFSAMYQIYERNGDVNSPDNLQLRLAYIYNSDAFTSKTTAARQSFAAEPYTVIAGGKDGNTNIKSEDYLSISQELTFKTDSTLNNILLSYAQLKDYPVIGESLHPENSDKILDIYSATYEFTYYYSKNDKFEFNLNYSNSDTAYTEDKAEIIGTLFRSVNTFGDFDLFNEFWIVQAAFSSEISVDYSAALSYQATKDLKIQLKGENLLDMAQKSLYIIPTSDTEIETLSISAIDRKVWLGLEYLF